MFKVASSKFFDRR